VFTPFLSHSRATRMLRLQLDIDRPSAKRAWAEIVKRKIANQATCLRLSGRGDAERLDSYARRVRSGDAGRMEKKRSHLARETLRQSLADGRFLFGAKSSARIG
jgi:CRISPR-associated protein Cas1